MLSKIQMYAILKLVSNNCSFLNMLPFTLNVIGGWLEIGPNYHITVMFDAYNMGQQSDMKFYAKREHPSSSQQL